METKGLLWVFLDGNLGKVISRQPKNEKKMVIAQLLTSGLTQRAPDWWESARFQAMCVARSWFRQNGVISSRPLAGNAGRWAVSLDHWLTKKDRASMSRLGLKAIVVAGTLTITYILSVSFAILKLISQQSNSYDGVIASPFLFLTGLVFFFARAESLLQSDYGTAYLLYKGASSKKAGLRYASIVYKLLGLIFMLIPIVINLSVFFTGG